MEEHELKSKGCVEVNIATNEQNLKILVDEKNSEITVITPAGNKIMIRDIDNGIVLADQYENNIQMNQQGITIASNGDLTLKAKQNIVIESDCSINAKAKDCLKMEANASAE